MPRVLQTFPELDRHTQEIQLDGDAYQVRLMWRARKRSWYMDVFTVTGEPIALGRRVSPQSVPLFAGALPKAPPGVFIVRGPARYTREALGESLIITYYSPDELPTDAPNRTFEVR